MISPQDAAELVRRTLDGDREAFAGLITPHQNMVFALARLHTRNWNEAEDMAQEVFLRAYRNLPKLRKPESFSQWLYGIALNTAKELTRAHVPTVSIESIPAPAAPEPERANDANAILQCVAELPDKFRIPLTLHYVDQVRYREIGAILGIDETSARSRVHRAKAMLRKLLARAKS